MDKKNLGYAALVFGLIVGPTALALSYHKVTNDPYFRPLAVTEEALRAFDGRNGDGIRIVAKVDWSGDADFSAKELERAIIRSFQAKGVDVTVRFEPARTTRITYHVGASYMGPYTTARAGDGIPAAVEAYHMLHRHLEATG